MAKAWQGRLPGGTDRRVEEFTESIRVDRRLFAHDIRASIAHATMLAEVGLVTAAEAADIRRALEEIGDEIAADRFPFDIALEDIHLHIESALIQRVGDAGRKLHTGRSRNDQVSTDLRLWLRDELDGLVGDLVDMQRALVGAARRAGGLILPAYTHMQRAQPVLAAHYFLAYVEKFERDRLRAVDCRRRGNVLSLGAAALAGTSLPIDRHRVAELLGFESVAANSLDVSSDRDFVLEAVFVLAMIAEHLSGWAEEWILWSTTEFDFLVLPDAFCTGSSIMPQKKNPDVLELIRGKTARVIGALQTLLVLVKGLPLAYNRDLQEDKPPLFDAMDTARQCLVLAAAMVENSSFKAESIAARLEDGYLDATTLMELLIQRGVPMRTAHEAVGRLVRRGLELGLPLAKLDDAEIEGVAPGAGGGLGAALGVRNAIAQFKSYGSTAPAEVEKQLAAWERRLSQGSNPANPSRS